MQLCWAGLNWTGLDREMSRNSQTMQRRVESVVVVVVVFASGGKGAVIRCPSE